MGCRAALAALLSGVALAGCGDGETGERFPLVVQDDAELLHRDDAQRARTLDVVEEVGATHVRLTAGWSELEPVEGRTDAAAWARLERAVDEARARGLAVMVDVAFFTPPWAADDAGPRPGAFGRFAGAVARRLAGRASTFTVWNEPNLGRFGLRQRDDEGRPSAPHRYRAMLEAAVPAIRAQAPEATVLVGATSSLGGRPSRRTPPLAFLRELACVDRSLRPRTDGPCAGFRPLPGDGWSHHPYSVDRPPEQGDPDPDVVRFGDLPELVTLLRALHARGRLEERQDVWVTEMGWQTNPPDPTQPVTLAEQAAWTARAYALARRTDGVASFAQFLVRDLPARPGRTARARWRDYQSGLEWVDGSGAVREKPALAALREAVRRAPGR